MVGCRAYSLPPTSYNLKLVLQPPFEFLRGNLPVGLLRGFPLHEADALENDCIKTKPHDPEDREDHLTHDHAQHVAEGHPAAVEPGQRRGEVHGIRVEVIGVRL